MTSLPSPKVTLRQLELFCAAAQTGSFAAAAQDRYVTPNAVAAAVGDLETTLGLRLCVRRRARGLVLTTAGDALWKRAQRLLLTTEEVVFSLTDSDGTPRGPVRVGCYTTLAATVIPQLWAQVGEQLPEVDLDVVEGTVTDLVEQLNDGQLDMMISYEVGLPTELSTQVLFTTEPHIILPQDHPQADRESLPLTALEEEQLILLDLPPAGDNTLELIRHHGVRPQIAHRTTSFELVRSMVARGFGYSLLFQHPSIDVSYEGRQLVSRPTDPPLGAEPVVLSWPSDIQLTARATAVAQLMADSRSQ